MRTYLVLTPPGGPQSDHRTTLVLPDGFSWLALFFPWIWLFWNRLWLAGAVILALQILSGFLMSLPGFGTAGALLGLAISLLVALEGRHYRSEALIRRGWLLESVISAPDLDTAEDIYFSGLPQPEQQPIPASTDWARQAKPATAPGGWPRDGHGSMGLFEHGGR